MTRATWRNLPFILGPLDSVCATIANAAIERSGGLVLTVNVSILRGLQTLHGADHLRSITRFATVDGWPIGLLLARDLRLPFPPRVPGSDLLPLVARLTHEQDLVVVVAASEGAKVAHELRTRHQSPGVLGIDLPSQVELGSGYGAQLASELPEQPTVLFLCLGFPKQEFIAAELLAERPDVIVVGAGASADFIAGSQTRAPRLMQRFGLEWLWRLASQPGRLFERYILRDLPFLLRQLSKRRRRGEDVD